MKNLISLFSCILLFGCASNNDACVSKQVSQKPENILQLHSKNKEKFIALWNDKTNFVEGETLFKNRKYALSNVSNPRMELFLVENGKSDNGFVIVCPGGGYCFLSSMNEGYKVVEKLNKMGVSACILWYRTSRNEALQDAQRAIRISRANAKKWNINPNKIAIMGFSAGADLSARAGCRFEKSYKAVDKIDEISARPDNTILVYPAYCDMPMYKLRWIEGSMENVSSKDYNHDYELTPHLTVSKDTSPTLIVQTQDDKNCTNSSIAYFLALKNAGVDANIFLCDKGRHSYGMAEGKSKLLISIWSSVLEKYLQVNEYIK
ncbi:MAG: alpha/beta hydrolase [Verrucomicrobiaceae bacterium]|nr:alpha/beta hydrolase [Verrucomicrobiaceae bacterium]